VTFTFAKASRTELSADRSLAFGVLAANAMLYPRVLIATAVLNLSLLPMVARYLALPALIAVALASRGMRQSRDDDHPVSTLANPLQLTAALQMAVTFQAMLMLVHLADAAWGAPGVYASAAVLGLTDVDALTVSMATAIATNVSLETAAIAIAIGVLANTALKLALTLLFGIGRFQRIAGGALALMALATLATIVLV
jgi:uncharacterized membrane protein (DUF4010 family)